MIGWLIELIPGWVWLIIAGGGLFIAWRFLGLRGLLAAAGAVALAFAYRTGRTAGSAAAEAQRDRERAKAKEERLEMHREATDAEREAAGMTDDEARKEALKWSKRSR